MVTAMTEAARLFFQFFSSFKSHRLLFSLANVIPLRQEEGEKVVNNSLENIKTDNQRGTLDLLGRLTVFVLFMAQLFYYIGANMMNNLLLRKDMCHWSRGMQIRLVYCYRRFIFSTIYVSKPVDSRFG